MGLSGGGGTPNLTTMNTHTQPIPTELHATIKLGIDAHAKWFYVARQLDGASPQPVRKMTPEGRLRSLAEQSRGLSGGDILNICLNAIHAGSRDPDPAKWVVTEEMLLREIKRAKAAKEKHSGRRTGGRRIGFRA
jgi:hypothetical protein